MALDRSVLAPLRYARVEPVLLLRALQECRLCVRAPLLARGTAGLMKVSRTEDVEDMQHFEHMLPLRWH